MVFFFLGFLKENKSWHMLMSTCLTQKFLKRNISTPFIFMVKTICQFNPIFLWKFFSIHYQSKKCCPDLSSEDSDLVIDFSFSHEVNHLNLGLDPLCFIAWLELWTNEILCIWLPKVLKLQQTHPCRENCRAKPSLIKWIPNDFFCDGVTHLLCLGSRIYYNTVLWIVKLNLLRFWSLDVYSCMR